MIQRLCIPLTLTHSRWPAVSDRSLWNWTLVAGAVLAIIGAVVARLLQAALPSSALNVVVAAFFTLCVLAMGGLVVFFALRRR